MSGEQSPEGERQAYAAPAAACAAELLLLLGKRAEALPIAELVRATGRSRSLVFRTAKELERRELLVRDPDGRYALGVAVLELSGGLLKQSNEFDSLRRAVRELMESTSCTVSAAVLRGAEILYVDRAEPPHAVITGTRVGNRLPATTTAIGKVLLAQPEAAAEVGRLPSTLPRLTSRSILDRASFVAQLDTVREQGYAIEDGETIAGRCCIAVPAFGAAADGANVGISVSCDAEELHVRHEAFVAALETARDRLCQELAGRRLHDGPVPTDRVSAR